MLMLTLTLTGLKKAEGIWICACKLLLLGGLSFHIWDFCHIHQCISIYMLADKLNMISEEAERQIVNLIRDARLDVKFDFKIGHVIVDNNAVSPYQQVIERTQSLSFGSQMLAMDIEKKLSQHGISKAPNLRLWLLSWVCILEIKNISCITKRIIRRSYNTQSFSPPRSEWINSSELNQFLVTWFPRSRDI